MTIYLLCLSEQITLPEVDSLRFGRSTLPRSKSANQKYSNKPDTTSFSSSIGTTTLSLGFGLFNDSRKVLQSAVASGTSNPQLGGEPGI
jgi:hypothetical protein